MNFDVWLPLLIVASSLVPGLVIFFLKEGSHGIRTFLNLAGAAAKLVLVGVMIWGVFHQHNYETRWTLAPGLDLVLRADTLSVLFVTLSTVLWLVTTVYAIGYMKGKHALVRFFGFFALCVSTTVGIAFAENLLTLFLFYELLTVCTYPLVIHDETPEALKAGRKYLAYTLSGGAQADTAFLTFEMGPAPHQPGRKMLKLRQFHLQASRRAGGPLGEDVENDRSPIEHLDRLRQHPLDVAYL